MRIAVNARMLTQRNPGGIGTYTFETLRRITARHREHDFLFIVDRPFPGRGAYPDNVSVARAFPSVHPFLWYPWFEWAVPRILRRFGADVFLSTDGFVPLSGSVPAVAVIHDMNFHHNPEDLPYLHSRYFNHFFPRYARKARTLATVSEHSRDDIVRICAVDPGKITVTGSAAGWSFQPLTEMERAKIRRELTGGVPYFLTVGALHPRKNLVRLIEAFGRFRDENPCEAKLVLAGPRMFKTRNIFQARKRTRFEKDVLFLGAVPDDRLPGIYGAARAFFFVSYFEGFGIPALEAMSAGVPVVAADRTALPEVCGDAAFYVDPFSVDAIAGAMKILFYDEVLRMDLVEKGTRRKDRFSWDRTADLLWQAVKRTLP